MNTFSTTATWVTWFGLKSDSTTNVIRLDSTRSKIAWYFTPSPMIKKYFNGVQQLVESHNMMCFYIEKNTTFYLSTYFVFQKTLTVKKRAHSLGGWSTVYLFILYFFISSCCFIIVVKNPCSFATVSIIYFHLSKLT